MYMIDDNAETWYTKRVGEEPCKTCLDKDQEQAVKDVVKAVHNAAL